MNTPNDNSTIGTNDQKRIEGHEEEKRLEAHSDTRVIPENASPSSTVAAAASIAGTEEAAKAADATDKPKEATQSDNEIPTIDVETPIRPQRVWSNIVLGLLVLMGAFVASYLLYYNYHGDTKTYPATAYATSVGHQSSKRTAPIHAEIGALYPAGTMAAQPVKGHAYGNHDKYSKDGARAITRVMARGSRASPTKMLKKRLCMRLL